MTKGRFSRNWLFIIIGIVVGMICWLGIKIEPSKIPNYTDFMSGILSFSSMATGFLMVSFALIPALPNSKLIQILKATNTDLKLLDRLLLTIIGFIVSSILSLFMFIFPATASGGWVRFLFSMLLGFFAFSIAEAMMVIHILLKVIGTEYKKENK
jgi:ABC-type Mn2+/Zn2+ transport system permease subunit